MKTTAPMNLPGQPNSSTTAPASAPAAPAAPAK